MSSISRYISSHGRYYRINDPPAEKETSPEKPAPPRGPDIRKNGKHERPPASRQGGLPYVIGSILPGGLDSGDILLLLVLFFLYKESKDEDFLIILVVLAFSIFK